MYVRGIRLGNIRRFGRRVSGTFQRYLYRGNRIFLLTGSATVKETGFLDQLQIKNPVQTKVTIGAEDEDSE